MEQRLFVSKRHKGGCRGEHASALEFQINAVIAESVDESVGDFPFITVRSLLTREAVKEADVREGDEVFFAGLFAPFSGKNKNYSIMRFGKIGMVPGERVPIQGHEGEVFLIDVQTYPGNSGSPAYINLNPTRNGSLAVGPPPGAFVRLFGVVSAVFLDPAEVIEASNRFALQRNGVGAVVPSYMLLDILYSDRMKAYRHEK